MTHYIAIIDGSGEVWGARVPDLPGVFGSGATADAAIADAISAAAEWAAHQQAAGVCIPRPRQVQAVLADPEAEYRAGEAVALIPLLLDAGRMVRANISLDAGLLEAIDDEAKRRGLTRSAFLASAARDKIKETA